MLKIHQEETRECKNTIDCKEVVDFVGVDFDCVKYNLAGDCA